MRFALLGNDPDGLDMARALMATGRHTLIAYAGPPAGLDALGRWGLAPQPVGDVEEILADPAVEAVVVAGGPAARPAQLRRALQSERHVLCAHPADETPDVAYEAAMLQADAGCVLLPLLPEALHPGVARLAEIARAWRAHVQAAPTGDAPAAGRPADAPRLIELERWSTEELLLGADGAARRPGLPGWDVLRVLGGEIAAVFAQTAAEELTPGEPVMLTGRYLDGPLFQATYLPNQAEARLRLAVVTAAGRATLSFPTGWPGPAVLTFTDADGRPRQEEWPASDPWAALVDVFEQAVAAAPHRRPAQPGTPDPAALTRPGSRLGWQDARRALELDDAARRSVARGRSSVLEYQEATEEANFKGTMTLLGCGLLWASLALLILSVWVPWLGWLIVPVFGLFLGLQVFGWVVPTVDGKATGGPGGKENERAAT